MRRSFCESGQTADESAFRLPIGTASRNRFLDSTLNQTIGRLNMNDTTSKNFWPIVLGLAVLMAATRSHHFASVTHLPDASWAVFFLAGFYLRPLWVFPALLG